MTRCFGAWWWDYFPCWSLFMPTLGWALGFVGDSAWEMVSLICGQRPWFSLQGFSLSLFHYSMSWAEKLILERQVSRAQAQQCPALLFRDYLYSDTTALWVCPELFTPHQPLSTRVLEKGEETGAFSVLLHVPNLSLKIGMVSTHLVQMPLAVECKNLPDLDLSKYVLLPVVLLVMLTPRFVRHKIGKVHVTAAIFRDPVTRSV